MVAGLGGKTDAQKVGVLHRVLRVLHRVLGVLHRVPGVLHRVLGVPHRVLGVVHTVPSFVRACRVDMARSLSSPCWACNSASERVHTVLEGRRWTV